MDCNCCWEGVVLKQWMGVETSYGQFLCQYMLHFNQSFGITVLGHIKTKLLIELQSGHCPVQFYLGWRSWIWYKLEALCQ